MNKEDASELVAQFAENPAICLSGDSTIGNPENKTEHIYQLLSGLAIQCQYAEDGERQVYRVFRKGDLIGMELLATENHGMIIETLTPAVVMRIPLHRVRAAQRTDPALREAILWLLANEVIDGQQLNISFGTGPAMRRICRFLLWAQSNGDCLLPNREKLGSIIATTTETASRMIADLKRQGALQKVPACPAKVRLDPEKLHRHARRSHNPRAA